MVRLTDIFRDATEVKEINVSDGISTIRDITTLTLNTDTSESSSSSDRSNPEKNRDGALDKNFHLPPQIIEGGNTLGYQIPNIRDTPSKPIPPNEQAAVERKYPNSSEEQESTVKGKTPGDKCQKESFDTSLDLIPTAGKLVEEKNP